MTPFHGTQVNTDVRLLWGDAPQHPNKDDEKTVSFELFGGVRPQKFEIPFLCLKKVHEHAGQ